MESSDNLGWAVGRLPHVPLESRKSWQVSWICISNGATENAAANVYYGKWMWWTPAEELDSRFVLIANALKLGSFAKVFFGIRALRKGSRDARGHGEGGAADDIQRGAGGVDVYDLHKRLPG